MQTDSPFENLGSILQIRSIAGLPDGLFSNQKSQFGYILVGLGTEIVLYFIIIWNILMPLGIIYVGSVQFVVILYIFPILVCLDQTKSGNSGPSERPVLKRVSCYSGRNLYNFYIFWANAFISPFNTQTMHIK
jgi:hypothetical protein